MSSATAGWDFLTPDSASIDIGEVDDRRTISREHAPASISKSITYRTFPATIIASTPPLLASFLTSQTTSHMLIGMKAKNWPVQDAKARFSELLETCVREGPQIVTRRGEETAVLVPMQEWKRLCQISRPSLKALLLTDFARAELTATPRGRHRRRSIPSL